MTLRGQVHPAALRFGGPPLLDMLRSFQRHASVPVFVTLDHAEHERDVETALRCGVDGVMVDGSARPFDENLAWTRRMVAWAHEAGAVAEAELGRLAGSEVPHCYSILVAVGADWSFHRTG